MTNGLRVELAGANVSPTFLESTPVGALTHPLPNAAFAEIIQPRRAGQRVAYSQPNRH
jgi:hypothetical protein